MKRSALKNKIDAMFDKAGIVKPTYLLQIQQWNGRDVQYEFHLYQGSTVSFEALQSFNQVYRKYGEWYVLSPILLLKKIDDCLAVFRPFPEKINTDFDL